MQWFNQRKIRTKLLVMAGVSVALTMAVGGFALWRMNAVNTETRNITEVLLPSVKYVGEIATAARNVQSLQYQHVAMPDESGFTDIEERLGVALADLARAEAAYEALPATDDEKKAYARMKALWARYIAPWEEIRRLSRAQKVREANLQLIALLDVYRDMNKALLEVREINEAGAQAAAAHAADIYAQSRNLVAVAVFLAALLSVSFAWLVSGRVARMVALLSQRATELRQVCITQTRRGLEAMAMGDLSVTVVPTTQFLGNTDGDEIGEISRAVDAMIADLRQTVVAYSATQQAMQAVMQETQRLVDAATRGDLAARADADRHQGVYGQLVHGLNGTLGAVATPIGEAREVLARLAEKDVTGRMSGRYQGDYAEMQQSINTAIANLESALRQVSAASGQVAAASAQITAGGQSLAAGSSEQAASLEEISASMQEFASISQKSAADAHEARSLAADARQDATEGSTRMLRLTEAVNDIMQASAETSKIVKSIEEIAFQTNLLALNAAVEAARAGDAGRGFAVVAEEVRNLAIRSASASKSTADLIERGLSSAQRGVAINAEVSQSLDRINAQVERVASVMAELASAAEQQSSGVSQIHSALEQLNGVTQQVAANAEESASAAEELSSQAAALNTTVAEFRLAEQGDADESPVSGVLRLPPRLMGVARRTAGLAKER